MIIIFFLIIIIIILILVLIIYLNRNNILSSDLKYFSKKIYKKFIGENIINNNEEESNDINKDKILIITCDNRPELDYIKIHNFSFESYTKKYSNIDYVFYTDCGKENIYWSRLFLIRNLMMQNKYKWIGWIDSDTMITNYDYDLNNLIGKAKNKDIIVADDNRPHKIGINSGIFFIKNSKIGFNFIINTINSYKLNHECKDSNNRLNGMFAGICYEQAQMELQIQSKYKDNTFIIPKNIVLCTRNDISDRVNIKTNELFIYHLIGTTTERRNIIFKKLKDEV